MEMKNVRSLDSFSYLNMCGVSHLRYHHLVVWLGGETKLRSYLCISATWVKLLLLPRVGLGYASKLGYYIRFIFSFWQWIGIHCLISGTAEVFLWRSNRGTSTSEYFHAGNVNLKVCFQVHTLNQKKKNYSFCSSGLKLDASGVGS